MKNRIARRAPMVKIHERLMGELNTLAVDLILAQKDNTGVPATLNKLNYMCGCIVKALDGSEDPGKDFKNDNWVIKDHSNSLMVRTTIDFFSQLSDALRNHQLVPFSKMELDTITIDIYQALGQFQRNIIKY